MMKIITLLLFAFTLAACNSSETRALENDFDANNGGIWVYAQFNVPEESDEVESYYYYGLIAESTYHLISQNQVEDGFILLKEVKYIGNDDIIRNYEDNENHDELVFRIEDIRRIELVKKEPIAGRGLDQFDDEDIEVNKPKRPVTDSSVNDGE